MYPIVDILCFCPAMNTHSKKWTIAIQNPMDHLNNDALNQQYFFSLPNTLDTKDVVQVIQSNTTSYDLQELDEEDFTEWRRMKKEYARARQMKRIWEKASMLKQLKRELRQVHKLNHTESGFPGICWWASSSDMLIYPSIFIFPLLPLHHQSTTTHSNCTWPHSHSNHACTHFIRLISLIWWTHDLQFTVFTFIISISNMHPPVVQPITSPHTVGSGTYYSFTSDEPYACFLVYHSYLTCLYFTFCSDHHQRRANQLPIQVSSRIQT